MKSWKKRLAVMLSAAMVMTAGTGMPGYGRSSAVSLKTALASVRTEGNSGAASEAKVTPPFLSFKIFALPPQQSCKYILPLSDVFVNFPLPGVCVK